MNQPVESILELLCLKSSRIILLIGVLIFESSHIIALVSKHVPVQRVILKRQCSHLTVNFVYPGILIYEWLFLMR